MTPALPSVNGSAQGPDEGREKGCPAKGQPLDDMQSCCLEVLTCQNCYSSSGSLSHNLLPLWRRDNASEALPWLSHSSESKPVTGEAANICVVSIFATSKAGCIYVFFIVCLCFLEEITVNTFAFPFFILSRPFCRAQCRGL